MIVMPLEERLREEEKGGHQLELFCYTEVTWVFRREEKRKREKHGIRTPSMCSMSVKEGGKKAKLVRGKKGGKKTLRP